MDLVHNWFYEMQANLTCHSNIDAALSYTYTMLDSMQFEARLEVQKAPFNLHSY